MKTRDLITLTRRIGHVEAFIKNRLHCQRQVNVLEIGCGLGVALSQLADQFPQVTFYGVNLKHHHGQINKSNIIYIYGDAGTKVELADESIDFAFSQQTLQRIADKAGCIKEVFRTLKSNGEFWYGFPPFLHGLYGPSTCTVSDGRHTLDFQDYLIDTNNPNVVVNEFQYKLGEGVLTKKMVAIAKKNDELGLGLEKDYSIEDLGLLDESKDGYFATHYLTQPTQMLPIKKKKVLIIAQHPKDYIADNHWLDETTSVSFITKDTLFMDRTPHTYSTLFQGNWGIENEQGVKVRNVLLNYITHAKFDQLVVADDFTTNPVIHKTIETIKTIFEKRGL